MSANLSLKASATQSIATMVLGGGLLLAVFFDVIISSQVNVLVWGNKTDPVAITANGRALGVIPAGGQNVVPVDFREPTVFEFRNLASGQLVRQVVEPVDRTRQWIVPADPSLCFVLTLMRPYWFVNNATGSRVVRRMVNGTPFDVAIREPYPLARVVLAAQPVDIAPHERIDRLDEIPCEIAHGQDENIVQYVDDPSRRLF